MFGSRPRAGVDLGEHSFHYAVVDRGRRTISTLWSAPLMPGRQARTDALEDGPLAARLEELAPDLHRRATPFVREVQAVIQGQDTVCGYLELPPLKASELATAVPAAAARKLPWSLDEVFLTQLALKPLDPASQRSAVFFVAVRLDAIERHRGLLARAGLTATGFDVPAVALAREAAANRALPPGEFVALVHAGFRLTQVTVIRDGLPYFYRDFPLAGLDLTYGHQMGAQCSWAEAEAYKMTYRVDRREPAMEAYLTRWLDDVKRSLDHFAATAPAAPTRVLLSGGTARMEGLAARLGEHLGLPAAVDHWERLQADRKTAPGPAPDYKPAVGAALQE